MPKFQSLAAVLLIHLCSIAVNPAKATDVLIDDRSTGTLQSSNAGEWRLITDQVMGGRSSGVVLLDQYLGRHCLRMRGSVSTANNGGFLQIALDVGESKGIDASMFDGLVLEVAGNGEHYNVHLRTSELWLPWQSYRSDFITRSQWREIRLPFSEFEPYKTKKRFNPGKLVRIGVVAIGRQFDADLCLGKIAFYNDDSGD
ncbi:MAG: CIA30 family protein [Gammaproteobacteria bacterium]